MIASQDWDHIENALETEGSLRRPSQLAKEPDGDNITLPEPPPRVPS